MIRISFIILLLLGTYETSIAQAQYFGQNKQRNKTNNFKVLQSAHFELYSYLENKKIASEILHNSENWYKIHQEVFKIAFLKPNPIIVYNNHPEFQETTAIDGQINEGTGGFTEQLKTRVVMPIMFTKRQTNHVLGHELVHVFQYQSMIFGKDSTIHGNLQNLPLFMVEGLAEYMTLGREDPHTAMWLRDAVHSGDIPSIKDLITKENKYFPYRWGQVFWTYVTALYGDDIIRPLFNQTSIYGINEGFFRVFKLDIDHFSEKFKNDIIQKYSPLKKEKEILARGQTLISDKNSSEMNISPKISPDGKLIAYISSKNVLSTDLYISDANTGNLVRKIESSDLGNRVDSYSFIENSVAWSPDGQKLALVIQSKGKNKLLILDIINGNKKTVELMGVSSFTNPFWSPDGNSIVVSGLKEGASDLYVLNLRTSEVFNLTNDDFSDIQPYWLGEWIYFVSDRVGGKNNLEKNKFSISRINVRTNQIESFDFLNSSDNFNPILSLDGENIYFLSDLEGFRNLFKYDIKDKKTFQLTDYLTGISGITPYSPALSIATKTGELVYNYFQNNKYVIIKASENDLLNINIENRKKILDSKFSNSQILEGNNIVQKNLDHHLNEISNNEHEIKEFKFKPKFKLDYLANSGIGLSSSRFGSGLGGGVSALFSDILGNNQVMSTLAMNGEIQDIGGQILYLNQKKPWQFGASYSHISYRFLGETTFIIKDTLNINAKGLRYYDAEVNQKINRLLIDEASFFILRPFNKYFRVELGAALNWYSFNSRVYPQFGKIGVGSTGNVYDFVPYSSGRSKKVSSAESGFNNFNLAQLNVAFVGDNTTFGTIAPLKGYRFRLEISKFEGKTSYNSILLDARKYKYLKPFSFASRIIYNGRLNPSNLSLLNSINPLYLGFPWNMHGFWGNALSQQVGLISPENLQGEQIALANFEIRLPFTGPKKLALIDFQYLPSDLNFFFDAGMAWSQNRKIGETHNTISFGTNNFNFKTSPIVTTGISLRANVLGYFILEPYLAVPYYNGNKQSVVKGINFMVAGW